MDVSDLIFVIICLDSFMSLINLVFSSLFMKKPHVENNGCGGQRIASSVVNWHTFEYD